MVHISRVPRERRGLECGCLCPRCGARLVARLGDRRAWHFAHHSPGEGSANCTATVESLLHQVAKRIVAEAEAIRIPPVSRGPVFELEDRNSSHLLADGELLRVAKASEEVYVHGIKPDVLVETEDGRTLAVEIRVTHAVDVTKRETLRASGLATLEIDLSEMRHLAWDEDELRKTLLGALAPYSWAFHPTVEEVKMEAEKASVPLAPSGDKVGYLAPQRCEAADGGVALDCLSCQYCGVADGESGMRCFASSGAFNLAGIREYSRSGRPAPTSQDKFPPRRKPAPVRALKTGFPTYRPATLPSQSPRKTFSHAPRLPLEVKRERIAKLRELLPDWADRIDYSNPDSSESFEWIPWKDRNFCMHCQRLAAGIPHPEGGTRYYCVNEACHLGGCYVFRK